MSKRTYEVTLPSGEVATRTSARPYTHAVAVYEPAERVRQYRLDEARMFERYATEQPEHADEYRRSAVESQAKADAATDSEWGAWSFCSRRELADKEARRLQGLGFVAKVIAVA